MRESAITITHLTKSFDSRMVVDDMNLNIYAGECFGLLGPNGAGKSTTIRILLGHLRPNQGKVRIWGDDIRVNPENIRAHIGVVAQFDSLDPDFTVTENLRMYSRYFGINEATFQSRLPDLLDFAMLSNRANDNVMSLSGGMRRRLSIARALVNNPRLILLDEPTTGLDPQARHLLWDRLKELKRRGLTILLTTHFMDEAERLCDRLAILDKGKIVATGAPHELIETTIRAEVVEIYGEGLKTILPHLQAMCAKATPEISPNTAPISHLEVSGETAFCYATQPIAVINVVHTHAGLRYLHRPANLEDVFLRLTGRDLRDD